jgi:hypothetical protein
MNSNESSFSLVPTQILERIASIQEKILENLEKGSGNGPSIGDYITEKEAQQFLGRKATWFWQMRNAGKIKFTKVGKKVFYRKSDLLDFIKSSCPHKS